MDITTNDTGAVTIILNREEAELLDAGVYEILAQTRKHGLCTQRSRAATTALAHYSIRTRRLCRLFSRLLHDVQFDP
jgi:hypothetical protein